MAQEGKACEVPSDCQSCKKLSLLGPQGHCPHTKPALEKPENSLLLVPHLTTAWGQH